ncbi:T-cell immunomodulatory protein [Rhagoletis pomonella]|uniref:T-cell immunomodulatory protein n=1 Tax=Rhagoletis pomonella TaxID=28610 RepID=UPI00177AE25C|nr:T-cell immunomodulatory protein [Rhagoletis pomonella]XP_036326959.1 T-cell immunomodulatory protein [Rhagoletis pomonella]
MQYYVEKTAKVTILFTLIVLGRSSDITQQVFGDVKEGIVAAFGDFNSDELTDVFIIRDEMSTLEILYGAYTEPLLRHGPYCSYEDHEITSVVPGDFDGDALMDVLVTLRPKRGAEENIYNVHVNWGGPDGINCSGVKNPIFRTKGEPLALDFNRDMIIDLFGLDEDGDRTFWIFKPLRQSPEKRKQAPPGGSGASVDSIRIPNANAYLDFNDDFTADLIVQTNKNYEVWYGRTEEKEDFSYNHSIDLSVIGSPDFTIGQAVFADFELEGVENIILPVCFRKDCSNSTILVYDGKNFRDIHVNFKDPQGVLWGFVHPIETDVYLKTITARSGDFNMDGYPDLILTLQTVSGSKHMQTFLLENVPCKMCNKPLKRTFEVKWNGLSPMGNETVAGAFYDFYQDGVLDVILIEKTKQGKYRPLAFRNTLDYDANFVKVIVLTGLINSKNPTQTTPLGRKRRTYGTNLPGPRIIYSTTTQEGDQQQGSSVQLPQSAYFALQLPCTIFGLGRTPNFVDSLTVGLGSKSRTWTQVIPNSQMNVVPEPVSEPQHWKAQLFVTPSKLILMSVVALGGTCLVIVLIILVLYIKEKREDKQEKLQEAHRFHFDAM